MTVRDRSTAYLCGGFRRRRSTERAKIIPNLGLFGRPVREGAVTARGINRMVLDRGNTAYASARSAFEAKALAAGVVTEGLRNPIA